MSANLQKNIKYNWSVAINTTSLFYLLARCLKRGVSYFAPWKKIRTQSPLCSYGSLLILAWLIQEGLFLSPICNRHKQKKQLQHECLRGYSSCQKPDPAWALHGLQLLSGHIHCSTQGPPCTTLQISPSPWFSVGWVKENKASHSGLLQELQGNLCSGTISPSSLTLTSIELFLSHILTCVTQSQCSVLLPFLKHTITEVPLASLMDSYLGSGGSNLKSAGTGYGVGSSWCLLTEATPAATPSPVNTLACTAYTKCWAVIIFLQHELSSLDAFSKDDLII